MRCSARAVPAAAFGISIHLTVLESPPFLSIQADIANSLMSLMALDERVAPLRSAPLLIGESAATSISENGDRGFQTFALPMRTSGSPWRWAIIKAIGLPFPSSYVPEMT